MKLDGDGADFALPVGAGGLQPGSVLSSGSDTRRRSTLSERGRGGADAAQRQFLPRSARQPHLQDGGHMPHGRTQP